MGLNQLKGQCHEYVGHRYIKVKLTFEYLRPRCWKATNVQNIYTPVLFPYGPSCIIFPGKILNVAIKSNKKSGNYRDCSTRINWPESRMFGLDCRVL